jgi:Ca2+-binding EF-hand superfamily protein
MYKFPENAVGEHKYAMLDVFQRVGGCTVSIKSKDGDQDLQVTTKAGNLNLKVSKPGGKGKASKQAAMEDVPLVKPKFEAAKAYLSKHNLEARLKDAMKAVINELPDDPVGFINNLLRETDDPDIIRVPLNFELTQTPVKKPFVDSAVLEKSPAQLLQEGAPDALREALERAVNDGSFEIAAKEAIVEESKTAKVQADENRVPSPIRSIDMRQEVRAALLGASFDGSLPSAVAEIDLRQEVRQTLLGASLDGSLPVALAEVAPPKFSTYYTNSFRGNHYMRSFAAELFKAPEELVAPPSSMIRDNNNSSEAIEFREQIKEFEKELSRDEIIKCKKAFSQCESPPPRDGTIKYGQLPQVFQILGQTLTADALNNLMNETGADEHGLITFPEFLGFVVEKREEEAEAREQEENAQELIGAFKTFDRLGTGFVSCRDLRSVMTGLGESFSADEVEHMIKEAGSNAAGQINYVEFARIMVAT